MYKKRFVCACACACVVLRVFVKCGSELASRIRTMPPPPSNVSLRFHSHHGSFLSKYFVEFYTLYYSKQKNSVIT
jgi:hypothetical protein